MNLIKIEKYSDLSSNLIDFNNFIVKKGLDNLKLNKDITKLREFDNNLLKKIINKITKIIQNNNLSEFNNFVNELRDFFILKVYNSLIIDFNVDKIGFRGFDSFVKFDDKASYDKLDKNLMKCYAIDKKFYQGN